MYEDMYVKDSYTLYIIHVKINILNSLKYFKTSWLLYTYIKIHTRRFSKMKNISGFSNNFYFLLIILCIFQILKMNMYCFYTKKKIF